MRGLQRDIELRAVADPLEFDPVRVRAPFLAESDRGGGPGKHRVLGAPHDANRARDQFGLEISLFAQSTSDQPLRSIAPGDADELVGEELRRDVLEVRRGEQGRSTPPLDAFNDRLRMRRCDLGQTSQLGEIGVCLLLRRCGRWRSRPRLSLVRLRPPGLPRSQPHSAADRPHVRRASVPARRAHARASVAPAPRCATCRRSRAGTRAASRNHRGARSCELEIRGAEGGEGPPRLLGAT